MSDETRRIPRNTRYSGPVEADGSTPCADGDVDGDGASPDGSPPPERGGNNNRTTRPGARRLRD